MDLINKLLPTRKQTKVKVFLISIFPFNFDKWAPKYPPVKEPITNNINIFEGIDPILLKKIAPVKFQKIPTVKNVRLIARRKSIPKVLIKSIVTSNPVQDNADLRLTEISNKIGLANNDRLALVKRKDKQTRLFIDFISKLSVSPTEINPILSNKNSALISQSMKLKKIYARPNITSEDILSLNGPGMYVKENGLSNDIIEQVEIQVKYKGYIDKEKANAEKLQNLENINIPEKFNYKKLKSLSAEAKSKLDKIRPKTLSQASRISGVSPSDISSILVFMGR